MPWKLAKKLEPPTEATKPSHAAVVAARLRNHDTVGVDGIGTAITQIRLDNQIQPGILIVDLHSVVDLGIPDDFKGGLNSESLPYAIVEFDGTQVRLDATSGSTKHPQWPKNKAICKYDVMRPADLNIRFYLDGTDTIDTHQVPVCLLGTAKLKLRLDGDQSSEVVKINLQQGEGHALIETVYVTNPSSRSGKEHQIFNPQEVAETGLIVVKKDTDRSYIYKAVSRDDEAFSLDQTCILASKVNSSFIAPLALAYESFAELEFLSPLPGGGQLLYYLQRLRRFDEETSKFYAAELLCALEYLGSAGVTLHPVKIPEAIYLDISGHLVIADVDLYIKRVAQPSEQGISTELRSFAVTLYEMLSEKPSSRVPHTDQTHSTPIIHDSLSLSLQAKDLLSVLSNQENGHTSIIEKFSEIKKHDFFQEVDWSAVLARARDPPIKPIRTGPVLPSVQKIYSFKDWVRGPHGAEPAGNQESSRVKVNQPHHEDDNQTGSTHDAQAIPIIGGSKNNEMKVVVDEPLNGEIQLDSPARDSETPFQSESVIEEDPLPPIVKAVVVGQTDIVKSLLKAGADPNTGYHDLRLPLASSWEKGWSILDIGEKPELGPVGFKCGRVVQLAMEMGRQEIVQELLDAGADVGMVQPEEVGHECRGVPRETWLRITGRLDELADGREGRKGRAGR